jgi:hypothetical protein
MIRSASLCCMGLCGCGFYVGGGAFLKHLPSKKYGKVSLATSDTGKATHQLQSMWGPELPLAVEECLSSPNNFKISGAHYSSGRHSTQGGGRALSICGTTAIRDGTELVGLHTGDIRKIVVSRRARRQSACLRHSRRHAVLILGAESSASSMIPHGHAVPALLWNRARVASHGRYLGDGRI